MISGSFTTAPETSETTVVRGFFDLSLSGIIASTVLLERSFDGGDTWKLVKTYTADDEEVGNEPTVKEAVLFRLRCTVNGGDTILYKMGNG